MSSIIPFIPTYPYFTGILEKGLAYYGTAILPENPLKEIIDEIYGESEQKELLQKADK